MGNYSVYRNQANRYYNEKNKIEELLNTVSNNINTTSSGFSSNNDYFSLKMTDCNTNVQNDVNSIKSNLDRVSNSLIVKARAIDAEIEQKVNEESNGDRDG